MPPSTVFNPGDMAGKSPSRIFFSPEERLAAPIAAAYL